VSYARVRKAAVPQSTGDADLTGAQIKAALEQQWLDPSGRHPAGLRRIFLQLGRRQALWRARCRASMTLNGARIEPAAFYPRPRSTIISRSAATVSPALKDGTAAQVRRLRRRRPVRLFRGPQPDRARPARPHRADGLKRTT